MCGVVGIIKKDGVDIEDVKKMNNAIIHRGPDSEGFYINKNIGLAMRRLKIIDLSSGDQPIFNEDGKILVFFNGEIYNYQDIREELISFGHTFKTKSDTEILVHGYEEWGIKGLLEKIEGMFVFSIYDINNGKILIARDRFGEKPLYYFSNNNTFYFSSEMKALLVNDEIPREINPKSLYHYLALHHVPEENTILKNVFRLRAGHYMEIGVNDLNINIFNYWNLQEKKINDSYDEAKNKVRELIEKSIKDRMVADVPVGAFLSGGIDSSIMVGIMSKHSLDLKTFSIGFENAKFDESEFSKEVAAHYKTDHHHFMFSEKDVSNMLPEVVEYMDEPIGDQALLPVLLISKEARKYVTVVLGGEGADEVFGGYDYYARFAKKEGVKNILMNILSSKKEFFDDMLSQTASGFPLITNSKDRMFLIDKKFRNVISDDIKKKPLHIVDRINAIKNKMQRAQYADIYSWLVDDLLIKYDRMGMAASIEGRAPYLDSSLVEYGFNLPTSYKWENNISKKILRDACNDLLPKSILDRRKHGFNLPMTEWLRGPLRSKLIESSEYAQNDLIDNDYYKKLIDNHLSGKEDRGRLLYAIMVYKLWCKSLDI